MVDFVHKPILDHINELIYKAEAEERASKYNSAIDLLINAEKLCIDHEITKIQGEIYHKLAINYQLEGDSAKTKEVVLESYQLALDYHHKALEIFNELKNEARISTALGFIDLLKYLFGQGEGEEKNLLESAKGQFNRAKLKNQEVGNSIDSLKMEILEMRALNLLIGEIVVRAQDEGIIFNELISEFDSIATNIMAKIRNKPFLSDFYYHRFLVSLGYQFHWIGTYLSSDILDCRQYLINLLNKCIEFSELIEDSEYYEAPFYAYTIIASFHLIIGVYFEYSQFGIKSRFKNARKWLKKADDILSRSRFNTSQATYHVTRFSIAIGFIKLGYSSGDFKHVLANLDSAFKDLDLFFPKTQAAHIILSASIGFVVGALESSTPQMTRITFAKKIFDLLEFGMTEVPMLRDPDYRLYEFYKNLELCSANAIMADLSEKSDERSEFLQKTIEYFNNMIEFSDRKVINNHIFYFYFAFISRVGILLAKHSSEKSEKIDYYQKAINLLINIKTMVFGFMRIETLFLIGDTYYNLGKLANDEEILEKASQSYSETMLFCRDKGFFNLVATSHVNLAQIEDRLGNFLTAADHYKKAIDSFDRAILTLTYPSLGKKIEKPRDYTRGWHLIELAKACHVKENHSRAMKFYEEASTILQKIREYRYESSFYSAWARLEKAEDLSKKNQHLEAAEKYLIAVAEFKNAIETLNTYLRKRIPPEEKDRISNLIKTARVREQYCQARNYIEVSRVESKQGNHIAAAELYHKAGLIFSNLCQVFRIKREKDELTATYYLCRAWEYMERAEGEQKPSLYAKAAELFKKAGSIFPEPRMKKLSTGNSLYCFALDAGKLFDDSSDIDEKRKYYQKIKICLRDSSKNYQQGGFEQDAQWASATSALFDGTWHLLQADIETDFSKKNQYLNLATKYLETALQVFEKAGYSQKKEEISNYLRLIDDEQAILLSALNVIEKPAISESSVGIVAPACPIEISSQLSVSEMQQHDHQTELEIAWRERIHHLYLFITLNGIVIYDHPFKTDRDIEPSLVSGGLAGISMIIQEITKKETKMKIVEQEDMTIMFEHGEYLSVALITEENLSTLRTKLKTLIIEVEEKYQEKLRNFKGVISEFRTVNNIVQTIFEK